MIFKKLQLFSTVCVPSFVCARGRNQASTENLGRTVCLCGVTYGGDNVHRHLMPLQYHFFAAVIS
jgi:hypothetical protein